jgi:hypothetical protein
MSEKKRHEIENIEEVRDLTGARSFLLSAAEQLKKDCPSTFLEDQINYFINAVNHILSIKEKYLPEILRFVPANTFSIINDITTYLSSGDSAPYQPYVYMFAALYTLYISNPDIDEGLLNGEFLKLCLEIERKLYLVGEKDENEYLKSIYGLGVAYDFLLEAAEGFAEEIPEASPENRANYFLQKFHYNLNDLINKHLEGILSYVLEGSDIEVEITKYFFQMEPQADKTDIKIFCALYHIYKFNPNIKMRDDTILLRSFMFIYNTVANKLREDSI